MSDKRTIIIEISEDERTIIVTNSDGEMFKLESLALFGGDARKQEFFIQMYGASADAAWSYGQGFRIAMAEGSEMTALKNFYKQSAAHCCMAIDPDTFRQEAGAEEIINKWTSDDQTKWALWDTEDVLEDKQKHEDQLDERLTGFIGGGLKDGKKYYH
jgi:hypothetical protein